MLTLQNPKLVIELKHQNDKTQRLLSPQMLNLQIPKLVIELKHQNDKTQSFISTPRLTLQNLKLATNSNAKLTKPKACY